MKYKVGDKVLIKSLDWYKQNKDNYGAIYAGNGFCFWKNMSRHCGEIMKITIVKVDPEDSNKGYYFMENCEERWTDEMIEGLVEEEFDLIPKFGEYSDNEPLDIPTMTTEFVKEHGLPCPEGYIFKDENGNVINATKIVLEKKKLKYPKTYEECFNICFGNKYPVIRVVGLDGLGNNKELFESFIKLKICRDAYWKIAGEEMGLGKPWKPDYTNTSEKKFSIWVDSGEIKLGGPFTTTQMLLSFPTAEMRDAFKENFDPDIKKCKMFL